MPPAAAEGARFPIPSTTPRETSSDPTNLPLGDYHLSTTGAAVGSIYACSILGGAPGAGVDGPWIRTNGTWDSTAKISVQGDVAWPAANVSITEDLDRRIISGNALPEGHNTGTFPIAPSDPAYQYDHNPNSISQHVVYINLPLDPVVAPQPGCLGGVLSDTP